MTKKLYTSGFLPVMPLSIVATKNNGRINFAPHGQVGTVTTNPSTLSLAVRKGGMTAKNILQTGKLSINIPSVQLVEQVKAAGGFSGNSKSKEELFSVFYGCNETPMVKDCLFQFNCAVMQTAEVYDTYMFLLDVLEGFAQDSCIEEDGTPKVEGIDVLLCAINGKYYGLGEPI